MQALWSKLGRRVRAPLFWVAWPPCRMQVARAAERPAYVSDGSPTLFHHEAPGPDDQAVAVSDGRGLSPLLVRWEVKP